MLAPSQAPAPSQVLHLPMPKLLAWLRDEQQAGQGLAPLTLTVTLTLTLTLTLSLTLALTLTLSRQVGASPLRRRWRRPPPSSRRRPWREMTWLPR